VSLIPVPPSSPYHSPSSLKFSCRTNVASPPPISTNRPSPSPRVPITSHSSTDSDVTLTDGTSGQLSPTHTYPPAPTPPRLLAAPPSPSAVHAKLDQLALRRHSGTRSVISQFILSPPTHASATPASEGLFSRALRVLRNGAPTQTNSFSLSPLPDGSTQAPTEGSHHHLRPSPMSHGPAPLITFHDTTPVFSVSSSTGVFEVHIDEVQMLGVDLGFWIAIALAYGEFLGDREVCQGLFLMSYVHTLFRGIWQLPRIRVQATSLVVSVSVLRKFDRFVVARTERLMLYTDEFSLPRPACKIPW
jgi:hypothetical protein